MMMLSKKLKSLAAEIESECAGGNMKMAEYDMEMEDEGMEEGDEMDNKKTFIAMMKKSMGA